MTFLKWVGGKTQLLPEFGELFPSMSTINGYIEPFIGGGSVFFHLRSTYSDILSGKDIYLSDINSELINCYKVVRDDVYRLMEKLKELQDRHCEEHYYKIRDMYPPGNGLSNLEKAACFIYLNKTGFNGLWRVNSQGKNNVHIGTKEKIEIFEANRLLEDSKLLQGVYINVMSFENILKMPCMKLNNLFIYLDPPYMDIGKNNFTRYTKDGFHLTKRSGLSYVFKELDKMGHKVMMSNSDARNLRVEYSNYNIDIVKAKRIINSKGDNRGEVNEVVITNYKHIARQKTIDDAW